jgi:hypothetical protein
LPQYMVSFWHGWDLHAVHPTEMQVAPGKVGQYSIMKEHILKLNKVWSRKNKIHINGKVMQRHSDRVTAKHVKALTCWKRRISECQI